MHSTLPLETIIEEINPPIHASIIWMHGLGADGHDFAGIAHQLQLPNRLGIRFIFPHAPIRPITLNNGFSMRAWYDIYSLENLHHEDLHGITASEQAIEQLIYQQQQAGIPASRIILAGFSQGGAIALHTGLRYPHRLGGIIGLSTYLPLPLKLSAEAHQANQNIPIFLAHGELDDLLPFSLGTKTKEYLQQSGYSVEWQTYSMGHEVCLQEIADISHWIQKALT